jgi:AcrR family transcriptional regulator
MATKPDTVSKILDGAISALVRQGPKKFSMSDICEEAGVARGTLYRYFKSKDEVLEAVGDHVSGMLSEAIQEAIALSPDLDQRIFVVLEAMTGFWSNHPDLLLPSTLSCATAPSSRRGSPTRSASSTCCCGSCSPTTTSPSTTAPTARRPGTS